MQFLINSLRYLPLVLVAIALMSALVLCATSSLYWLFLVVPMALLSGIGVYDLFHPNNNLLRIYPLLAYFRFVSEEIRPEIHQYFVENDIEGKPLSRNDRELVYERAAKEHQEKSFGTELDV